MVNNNIITSGYDNLTSANIIISPQSSPSYISQTAATAATATTFNISKPMIPVMTNYLLLSPLFNFNNRVSQAAQSLPEFLGQSGQRK